MALARTPSNRADWQTIPGGSDYSETLSKISCSEKALLHFASPPLSGAIDTRTAHLLNALEETPPWRIVYISTSGVYGGGFGCKSPVRVGTPGK